MDTGTQIVASMAGCCLVWHIVASLLIYDYLLKRGQKASFIRLRVMILSYAVRYQEITRRETGRTGALFYHWVISINLAWILTITAIAIHRL